MTMEKEMHIRMDWHPPCAYAASGIERCVEDEPDAQDIRATYAVMVKGPPWIVLTCVAHMEMIEETEPDWWMLSVPLNHFHDLRGGNHEMR